MSHTKKLFFFVTFELVLVAVWILGISHNNSTYLCTLKADEIKAADENARRAADDCQHLQDELRKAQTEANNMDKLRRNLSSQVKDLQGRLDESEAARAGAGKRQIANLELRVSSDLPKM